MKTKFFLAIFILVTVFLSKVYAIEQITIAGSGDPQTLLRLLAAGFEMENPGTKINVPDSVGSGGGIRQTGMGVCDMGRVARDITESEKKYNLKKIDFAYSPVVFAVNPSVSNITNLSDKQIIGIYSGKIKTWEEIGAKNGKIYVASREDGDTSTAVIKNNITGFSKIEKLAGKTLFSAPDMMNALVKYKNTIGFLSLSETKNTYLKILSINDIKPTKENIEQGLYKLSLNFGLVYKKLNPLSKRFIQFIKGPKGKEIITQTGALASE